MSGDLAARIAADLELQVRARGWTARVRLGFAEPLDVEFVDGAVRSVAHAATDLEPDLELSAPGSLWEELASGSPRRSFAGSALSAELESTPLLWDPSVFPYVGALHRLVELAGAGPDGPDETVASPVAAVDSGVSGGYLELDLDGVSHRVFVQESGTGTPLVLLHPGGGDSRVWRHLLGDEGLRAEFRMVAIDLPYHGKSLPPEGVDWWAHSYEADQGQAADAVLAALEAVGVDDGVVVGIGFGAQVAIELLARTPERFRGAAAINPSPPPGADRFPADVLFHPRVYKRAFGCWVAALMPADTPKWRRGEAEWIFASHGPGVAKGDTEAEVRFDLPGALARLAPQAPPVELLEDDGYLLPLERPAELARRLAAVVAEMPVRTPRGRTT